MTKPTEAEPFLKLINEVFGLAAFEHEIREVIGNTNWNVLAERARDARAAYPALTAALAVEAGTDDNQRMSDEQTLIQKQEAIIATLEAALTTSPASYECAALKQGSAGGNDPADCDWPFCGCDPHANTVIAALQEWGWSSPSSGVEGEAVAWRTMDSAPKDGTLIIGRTTHDDVFACAWFWDDEGRTSGDWLMYGTDVIRPSEWIHIPASPAPQTEGK